MAEEKVVNPFLKVDKSLFSLGLDAFEILIVAQILEYQSKGMECYITNETFAEWYGTSVSTIKRRIDNLEAKKIIKRDTKNIQKGKERHLTVLIEMPDSSAKFKKNLAERSNCSLRKEQNEPIKDKEKKINTKDNGVMNQPTADCITLENAPRGKVEAVKDVMKNSTNSEGGFKF